MNHKLISLKWALPLLTGLLVVSSCSTHAQVQPSAGPAKVELRQTDGRWLLYVNNQPFYIKGAGVELGPQEKVKEYGGNSVRTWSTDNGRDTGEEFLDCALTNGLMVAMGLDVDHERRGFDYSNTNMVAKQFALLKSQVLQYRNHPALLMWVVGNELNFEKNPKVWDAVNQLSKMIHEVDPNHPTTTTLAGFDPATVKLVQTRAPDLDFLSFQMYADIINLPKYLRAAHWDKPYLVTEWGATGHWECGKTAWGAPIENDSTTKADLYLKRYQTVIASDQKLCLGSYVFLWGNKQERTPTWYGMFLSSGEETAPVDVMQYVWTGAWPAVRCPQLVGATLDGKTAPQNIHLIADQTYHAQVTATDPNLLPLTYHWEIMHESTEKKVGGDKETQPARVPDRITDPARSEITLEAPDQPGPYRLFAYVHDGHGHAAHVNIPFFVDAAPKSAQAAASAGQFTTASGK